MALFTSSLKWKMLSGTFPTSQLFLANPGFSAAGLFQVNPNPNAFAVIINKGNTANTLAPLTVQICGANTAPDRVLGGLLVNTSASSSAPEVCTNSALTASVTYFFCATYFSGGNINLYCAPVGGTNHNGPSPNFMATTTAFTGNAIDTDTTATLFTVAQNGAGGAGLSLAIGWLAAWQGTLTKMEASSMCAGTSPDQIRPQNLVFWADCINAPGTNQNRGVQGGWMRGTTATADQSDNLAIELNPMRRNGLGNIGSTSTNPVQRAWGSAAPALAGARPFFEPIPGPVGTPTNVIDFRKSLSGIGGRIGSRQIQGWGM